MSDHDTPSEPIPSRLEDAAADGCEEARAAISRRMFLGLTASLSSWAFMPRSSQASPGDEKRLLIVVLRGAMDGLHVAVPLHEPQYLALRGNLALDLSKQLPLDGNFSLNNAMPRFHARFRQGDAALVHAIAPPLRVRSHFQCQDNLENGLPGRVVTGGSGWLNRLLAALPKGNPVRDRGALGVGTAPLILSGSEPIMTWSPAVMFRFTPVFERRLLDLYRRTDRRLFELLSQGLRTDAAAGSSGPPGSDPFLVPFRGAANLMSSVDGARIGVLSVDGWDTHANQVQAMTVSLARLDSALETFRIGMGAKWQSTVVVCVTEFGRTARATQTGTDHGTGTVALLAGGAVNGGRVHCDWPGLSSRNLLEDRDLDATTDTRALFKGIARDFLGVPDRLLDETIFPASKSVKAMRGLIKSAG